MPTTFQVANFAHFCIRPATPRLFLEVKAKPELSLTLPYQIEFILRRARKDGCHRPCVFRWSPSIDGFSASGIVLLRHADSSGSDGFEICDVDQPNPPELPNRGPIVVDGQNDHLCELAPGSEKRFVASLPAWYYQALHAGETYTMLYPGSEVPVWGWGTIEGHLGKEMKARHLSASSSADDTNFPTLMIPGGARVSFTTRAEETAWPERPEYEARYGFEMANRAEQQWRQEEARKSMRIIEGWPAPFGPADRVYAHRIIHPLFSESPTGLTP